MDSVAVRDAILVARVSKHKIIYSLHGVENYFFALYIAAKKLGKRKKNCRNFY